MARFEVLLQAGSADSAGSHNAPNGGIGDVLGDLLGGASGGGKK
jgi:hypothetical protein